MRRVLILSDHPLFGRCVESLLQRQAGVEVLGRESDVDRAILRMRELRPDVVVVDCGDTDCGVAALARVLQAGLGLKVIGLSRRDNTLCICCGEQRAVSDTADLLHAIEADLIAGQGTMG